MYILKYETEDITYYLHLPENGEISFGSAKYAKSVRVFNTIGEAQGYADCLDDLFGEEWQAEYIQ
jgi:hypothetical protein